MLGALAKETLLNVRNRKVISQGDVVSTCREIISIAVDELGVDVVAMRVRNQGHKVGESTLYKWANLNRKVTPRLDKLVPVLKAVGYRLEVTQ